MSKDRERLFARLVEHYDSQARVAHRIDAGPAFDGTVRRCATIRYGAGTVGLLEFVTVVFTGHEREQSLTWTPNFHSAPGEVPAEAGGGSTAVVLTTWDQARATIDGEQSAK